MLFCYHELTPVGGYGGIMKNKKLLLLAIPVIIEQIAQWLFGFVDAYFVSQAHPLGMSSVGASNVIINVLLVVVIGLGTGGLVLLSQVHGTKDKKRFRDVHKTQWMIQVVFGLLMGAILLVFINPLLGLMNVSNEIFSSTKQYLLIVGGGIVFVSMMTSISNALKAIGYTRAGLYATVISSILNIFLDYLLVIVFNFGIAGAAVATVVSRGLGVIYLVMIAKKMGIWGGGFDKGDAKSILSLSLPSGLERFAMRSGQVVYNRMIFGLGAFVATAHYIAGNIEMITYMPAMGFGTAGAILVGNAMGEGNREKAFKAAKSTLLYSGVWMITLGCVMFVSRTFLVSLFTSDDAIIKMASDVLGLIACFQIPLGISVIMPSLFQGGGNVKFPMYVTLIGTWGFRVVFVYVFAVLMDWGLWGVWIAYSLDISIRAIILSIKFMRKQWMIDRV